MAPEDLRVFVDQQVRRMNSLDIVSYELQGVPFPGMYVDVPMHDPVSYAWIGYPISDPGALNSSHDVVLAACPISELDDLLAYRFGLSAREGWIRTNTTVLLEGAHGLQELQVWAGDPTRLVATATDGPVGVALLSQKDSFLNSGQLITRVTAPGPFIDEWASAVLRDPGNSRIPVEEG